MIIMEKFQDIYEDIELVTNKEVIKQNKISIPAIVMLVAAVGSVLYASGMEDPNSVWSTFLFTLAVILVIASVIKFLAGRNSYFFRPTGSKVQKITLYYDAHQSSLLQNCMEAKRFDDLKSLKKQVNTGVRVDAMVAGDQKFAAVQISEYVPYNYEAVTPVICYYGDDAGKLASILK